MNNLNPRRRLFIAVAGGLAGFFILLLARTIAIGIAVASTNLIFGGSNFSLRASFILFGIVPILIIIGTAIPAWAIGVSRWRGFLAGVIATGVFVFVAVGRISISSFNKSETLAFMGAIFATILTAVVGGDKLRLRRLAVMIVLAVTLASLRLALPDKSYMAGFALSLLAWILLPLAAAFFAVPEKT